MSRHLTPAATILALSLSAVTLPGCEDDLCARALARYEQCTGDTGWDVDESCDRGAAEDVLLMDCDEVAGAFGKADSAAPVGGKRPAFAPLDLELETGQVTGIEDREALRSLMIYAYPKEGLKGSVYEFALVQGDIDDFEDVAQEDLLATLREKVAPDAVVMWARLQPEDFVRFWYQGAKYYLVLRKAEQQKVEGELRAKFELRIVQKDEEADRPLAQLSEAMTGNEAKDRRGLEKELEEYSEQENLDGARSLVSARLRDGSSVSFRHDGLWYALRFDELNDNVGADTVETRIVRCGDKGGAAQASGEAEGEETDDEEQAERLPTCFHKDWLAEPPRDSSWNRTDVEAEKATCPLKDACDDSKLELAKLQYIWHELDASGDVALLGLFGTRREETVKLPDLTAEITKVKVDEFKLTVSGKVCNAGPVAVAETTKLVLRVDTVVAEDEERPEGEQQSHDIPGGKLEKGSAEKPSCVEWEPWEVELEQGTYEITALADALNDEIYEIYDWNNLSPVRLLRIDSAGDRATESGIKLKATLISVTPKFQGTVCNEGDDEAVLSEIFLVFVDGEGKTTRVSVPLTGDAQRTIVARAADGEDNPGCLKWGDVSPPSDLAAGTYQVHVEVTAVNEEEPFVSESKERTIEPPSSTPESNTVIPPSGSSGPTEDDKLRVAVVRAKVAGEKLKYEARICHSGALDKEKPFKVGFYLQTKQPKCGDDPDWEKEIKLSDLEGVCDSIETEAMRPVAKVWVRADVECGTLAEKDGPACKENEGPEKCDNVKANGKAFEIPKTEDKEEDKEEEQQEEQPKKRSPSRSEKEKESPDTTEDSGCSLQGGGLAGGLDLLLGCLMLGWIGRRRWRHMVGSLLPLLLLGLLVGAGCGVLAPDPSESARGKADTVIDSFGQDEACNFTDTCSGGGEPHVVELTADLEDCGGEHLVDACVRGQCFPALRRGKIEGQTESTGLFSKRCVAVSSPHYLFKGVGIEGAPKQAWRIEARVADEDDAEDLVKFGAEPPETKVRLQVLKIDREGRLVDLTARHRFLARAEFIVLPGETVRVIPQAKEDTDDEKFAIAFRKEQIEVTPAGEDAARQPPDFRFGEVKHELVRPQADRRGVTFEVEVCNEGATTDETVEVVFYRELDQAPPLPKEGQAMTCVSPSHPAIEAKVGLLGPFFADSCRTAVIDLEGLAAGRYAGYLQIDPFCVREHDAQTRGGEHANHRVVKYEVPARAGEAIEGIDLVIHSFSASSNSGRVNAQAVVCNIGTTGSPRAWLQIYDEPEDGEAVGEPITVPQLAQGKCTEQPLRPPRPLELRPGEYRLSALVDPDDEVVERHEDNNRFDGDPLTVTRPPSTSPTKPPPSSSPTEDKSQKPQKRNLISAEVEITTSKKNDNATFHVKVCNKFTEKLEREFTVQLFYLKRDTSCLKDKADGKEGEPGKVGTVWAFDGLEKGECKSKSVVKKGLRNGRHFAGVLAGCELSEDEVPEDNLGVYKKYTVGDPDAKPVHSEREQEVAGPKADDDSDGDSEDEAADRAEEPGASDDGCRLATSRPAAGAWLWLLLLLLARRRR